MKHQQITRQSGMQTHLVILRKYELEPEQQDKMQTQGVDSFQCKTTRKKLTNSHRVAVAKQRLVRRGSAFGSRSGGWPMNFGRRDELGSRRWRVVGRRSGYEDDGCGYLMEETASDRRSAEDLVEMMTDGLTEVIRDLILCRRKVRCGGEGRALLRVDFSATTKAIGRRCSVRERRIRFTDLSLSHTELSL
ncbi:hypothetical protein PIB30_036587 [Stylosanthes scabra]|uniref:Uncharacterized protein n=1 Tax=Stylosanthes scabra TaxID=79078 RepID=A0ABU6ZB54_9FABA|nr:hypothetical protein [Stylosanthes scabra]